MKGAMKRLQTLRSWWAKAAARPVKCRHEWHFIGWRPERTGARRVYQCRKCLRCKAR